MKTKKILGNIKNYEMLKLNNDAMFIIMNMLVNDGKK